MDTRTQVVCGTLAGLAGATADYPLDTIKTRMQLFSCTTYGGYMDCAGRLLREEGVRGFYKGLSVPLLAQGAENAVLFSVFQSSLLFWSALCDSPPEEAEAQTTARTEPVARTPTTMSLLLAASTAGFAVSFILTPVEYVKCNMQAENNLHGQRRAHHCLASFLRWSWQTGGLLSFYRGFTGTVARAVPGNAAYFYTYTTLKRRLSRSVAAPAKTSDTAHVPLWWHSILAGGLSGCAYWTVMFPADVVKTRMQVDPEYAALGFRCSCRLQVKRLGLCSLYSGWCITALRAFVSSSVVFTVYEHSVRLAQ